MAVLSELALLSLGERLAADDFGGRASAGELGGRVNSGNLSGSGSSFTVISKFGWGNLGESLLL